MIKTVTILVVLLSLGLFLPDRPIDPWQTLNPKSIFIMVFALVFIQAIGIVLKLKLGNRTGRIFSGFLGGIVSSTITTAQIATKNKNHKKSHSYSATATIVASILAMLTEGIAVVLSGTEKHHTQILIIFVGPILISVLALYRLGQHPDPLVDEKIATSIELIPILKLTVFIISILALSKWIQVTVGQTGLFVLTFFVSLFEVHGSLIANIQLLNSKSVSSSEIGTLMSLSVAASYASKYLLIVVMGSRHLRMRANRFVGYSLVGLGLSWGAFQLLN